MARSAGSSPRWPRSRPSPRRAFSRHRWGSREHVSEIFDGTGVELRFEDAAVDFRFESLEAAADEYWNNFPPIVMLRRALEPEGRGDEFREALQKTFEESNRSQAGDVAYPGEYLIALGEKRA
jgi:hypothetical protein